VTLRGFPGPLLLPSGRATLLELLGAPVGTGGVLTVIADVSGGALGLAVNISDSGCSAAPEPVVEVRSAGGAWRAACADPARPWLEELNTTGLEAGRPVELVLRSASRVHVTDADGGPLDGMVRPEALQGGLGAVAGGAEVSLTLTPDDAASLQQSDRVVRVLAEPRGADGVPGRRCLVTVRVRPSLPRNATREGCGGARRSSVRCASAGLCSPMYTLCTDGVVSSVLDASPAGLVCSGDRLVPARAPGSGCGAAGRHPVAGLAGAAASEELCRKHSSGAFCTVECASTRTVCGRAGGPVAEVAPSGKACLGGSWVDTSDAVCSTRPDPGCLGAPLTGSQVRCAAVASAAGGEAVTASSASGAATPGAELRGRCSPLVFTCDRGRRLPVTAAPMGTRCVPAEPIATTSLLRRLGGADLGPGVLRAVRSSPLDADAPVLLGLSAGTLVPSDDTLCFESGVAAFSSLAAPNCGAGRPQAATLGLLLADKDTTVNAAVAAMNAEAEAQAGTEGALPLLWRCAAPTDRLCSAEAVSCPAVGDVADGIPRGPVRGPPGTACFGGAFVPWDHEVCAGLADVVTGSASDRLDPSSADAVARSYATLGLVLDGVPAAAAESLQLQVGVRRALGSLYAPRLAASRVRPPSSLGTSPVLVVPEQLILVRAFDAAALDVLAVSACGENTTFGLGGGSAVPRRSLSALPVAPWSLPAALLQGEGAAPAEVGAAVHGAVGGGVAALQVFLGGLTNDDTRSLAASLSRDLADGTLERRLRASAGVGAALTRLLLWNGTGCPTVDAADPVAPVAVSDAGLVGVRVVDNPRHPDVGRVPNPFQWWLDLPEWLRIVAVIVLCMGVCVVFLVVSSTRQCCGRKCSGTMRTKPRAQGGRRRVIRMPNGRRRGQAENDQDGLGVPSAVLPRPATFRSEDPPVRSIRRIATAPVASMAGPDGRSSGARRNPSPAPAPAPGRGVRRSGSRRRHGPRSHSPAPATHIVVVPAPPRTTVHGSSSAIAAGTRRPVALRPVDTLIDLSDEDPQPLSTPSTVRG